VNSTLTTQSFFTELERANAGTRRKDVVILGAGIAGLVAGYELSRLGHRVRIFEASQRIGGRIYTRHFAGRNDDLYAELGAMRLPRAHRFAYHYVDVAGLNHRLSPFQTVLENEDCFLESKGRVCRIKNAVNQLQGVAGIEPLPRARSPYTLPFATALKIVVDAVSPLEVRESFAEDLRSGALQVLDEILADEVFSVRPQELTPRMAVRHVMKLQHVWSPSVAIFMRDIGLEASAELDRLDGGMSQLPEKLAAILRDRVVLDRPVVGLSVGKSGVAVQFADGERLTADNVLCTIPFTVLRGLQLQGFSETKLEAIREHKYHNASKVFFLCKERFWERAGIAGGASISDQRFRQLYYPPRQPQQARGVLLASYVIGDESYAIGEMSEREVKSTLGGMIAKLHPELMQPGMIQEVINFSWAKHEWSKGACSVTYRHRDADVAGHITAESLQEQHDAVVRPENHLYFAGEHCSDNRAWIEGAITSSLSQVLSIVQSGRDMSTGRDSARKQLERNDEQTLVGSEPAE
jgi:monoamine oxidase